MNGQNNDADIFNIIRFGRQLLKLQLVGKLSKDALERLATIAGQLYQIVKENDDNE